MSRSKCIAVCVATVAICACPVLATPIVNGTVGAGEYATTLTDPAEPGAVFFNSGLDIDKVHFDADATGGSRYMGLTVTVPPFDTNGSNVSFIQSTGVVMYFYANDTTPLPSIIMNLAFNALGFIDDLSFYREYTTPLAYTETDFDDIVAGVDYDIAAGAAMEFRISKSAFKVFSGDDPNFPSYVRMQLDDTGFNQDDQIAGDIPEPASLAILAIGGLAMLKRRRK